MCNCQQKGAGDCGQHKRPRACWQASQRPSQLLDKLVAHADIWHCMRNGVVLRLCGECSRGQRTQVSSIAVSTENTEPVMLACNVC